MTQLKGEQSPTLLLTFDPPPSVNAIYRRTRYSVVLTNEAKAWKEYAQIIAPRQGAYEPLAGGLSVTYRFYGMRHDFDNPLKLLNDAMNGIAWIDDAQILEAHIYVNRKTKPARVELEVMKL
jgi:Holliday junction resolvase RusA-like endonuclease